VNNGFLQWRGVKSGAFGTIWMGYIKKNTCCNFNYGEFATIKNKSGLNSFEILNLLLSVMAVSVKTVDVEAGLPVVEWE
jgi:hypothetical protein